MEGLLFFRVYPSDGFRFILIPDGNLVYHIPDVTRRRKPKCSAFNAVLFPLYLQDLDAKLHLIQDKVKIYL
jgi:hypothetical protein